MTLRLILVILFIVLCVNVFANDGMGDFPRNNVNFSNRLFKEEIKINEGENFVISPMSLNMAMSLAANGADGDTLSEFGKLLQKGSFDIKAMNVYNRNLLANSKQLKVNQYNIANGVWIKGDYNRNFYLVAKNYYNGEVKPLVPGCEKEVNQWIDNKTNGKITNLIDKFDPNEKACIVNTVYFYSEWLQKFPIYKTNEKAEWNFENGEKGQCVMMNAEGKYKVVDYNGGQILIKPLKGFAAMYFMLPPEGMKLADYVQKIDFNNIIINDIDGEETYKIWVPKFNIEYKETFNNTFKNLGLNKAFIPGCADFGKLMKGDFYISSVIHKATIGVDEKGTEASAATVVRMAGMGMPHPTKEIHFDRPFAFALVDELDNVVIFEGCVYKP